MKQLIFPFAIKSFEEISSIADIVKKEYLKELEWYNKNYDRASNSWNCSNSLDFNNLAANESGERLIQLLDSCPYEDLKDSRLLGELIKRYQHYRI